MLLKGVRGEVATMSDRLQVKVLEDAPFKPELKPGKVGDAGLDLCVCIKEEKIVIPAGGMVNIPTGVAIKLPWGMWASIRPRSSTFAKKRLFIMDGTIDNGYTGPLLVFVFNPNKYDVVVNRGDRLAQLVLHELVSYKVDYVDELPLTERGNTGFGSTGGFSE
jgi:dUTP pyrophosphatase